VAAAAAEQLVAALHQRRAIGEDLRALAQATIADPSPHDAQAQLPEQRDALREAVDAKAVLGRIDEAELEVAAFDVGAHAR
jgi:hypothetical protein